MHIEPANMGHSKSIHVAVHVLFFVYVSISMLNYCKARTTLTNQKISNSSVSAVFVFGDSTVDPGNNNYISTVIRSNFTPYGIDFPNGTATGRFSDGKLCTDFIASHLGVKELVPPYLDRTLSMKELMTGVSFASAGSGFDPSTSFAAGIIPIPKQIEYFREYKGRLEAAIGKERSQNVIQNAVFIISGGTNDFVLQYFPFFWLYTLEGYRQFILQQLQYLIKDLNTEGAKKIVITSLPPMGCLPYVITTTTFPLLPRACNDDYSSVARGYNTLLQKKLIDLQKEGLKLLYADIYTPLDNFIKQPTQFGFDEVNKGCCGFGLLEAGYICSGGTSVCPNRSKYVFWDSVHPTQQVYDLTFQAFRPSLDLFLKP